MTVDRPLRDLAAHGSPRGAEAVLAGARAGASRRRRQRQAIVVAGGFVGACVLTIGLWVGGPEGAVETRGPVATTPEAPTSMAPTTADPSTASGGSTTSTTSPPASGTTPPTTPATARPDAGSTGPSDPSALVPVTGEEVEAMMRPGAVIENVDITGGNIDVVADDVTIRNFRLDAAGAPYGFRSVDGHAGFTAEDGEIHTMTSAAFYGGHATLRRLEVHESGGDAFKLTTDVVVEASWWHHLGTGDGASGNGVNLLESGRNLVVEGNFCDLPVTVPAPYKSSSCVLVGSGADGAVSASIAGNWLDGGTFTVQCSGHGTVAVIDNRFGRAHRSGPIAGCPDTSGNVWDDTGDPL